MLMSLLRARPRQRGGGAAAAGREGLEGIQEGPAEPFGAPALAATTANMG